MKTVISKWIASLAILGTVSCAHSTTANAAKTNSPKLSIEKQENKVDVKIDGELFTAYHHTGQKLKRAFLWPIISPTGVNLVRNYPVVIARPTEAKDHPHHAGLWFAHEPFNGVNFWHNNGKTGKQVLDKLHQAKVVDGKAVIKASHKWLSPEGKTVCTDDRVITVSTEGQSRIIDFQITLKASHGKLEIGDSKEGTMAIRTHPALRIRGKVAKGKAVNSQGDRDKKLWGKSAKWVDYWAPIEGETLGVAIFDHPSNFRYPTTWHARDYGLIAANQFGIHYFKRKPKNAGNHIIPAGKQLTFKFRFVFHKGDAKQAQIEKLYQKWISQK